METSDSKGLIRGQAGNREITISIDKSSSIFSTDCKVYYKNATESEESCRQVILTTSTTGVLSGVLTQLINGETYDFYLKKKQRLINRETQIAHIQMTPTLTPPAEFKAQTSRQSSTIHLSWSLVPNATGYLIERALCVNNVMNFITIQTISNGQMTTYIDKSGLVNGEWYSYRIAAIDSQSRSAFSSTVSAVPQLTTPTNFKAVGGIESAAIVLSWESVIHATGYLIERALGVNNMMNFTSIQTISNGQMTTYIDKSGLVNGEWYSYRIAAIDSRSRSAFSSTVSAVPQLTPPTNFKAVGGIKSAAIVLSWASVTNATGYRIERALAANDAMNFPTIQTISNGQMTTYIDKSGLVNDKTYNYRIASIDRHLTSVFSSFVSSVPQLTPPINFKAVGGIESAAIVLSWAFVKNATGYRIERALAVNDKMNFTTIKTISNGQTITYTDKSGLVNGKAYHYMIVAVDRHLTSVFSSIASAVSQLTEPSNFQAITGNESAAIVLSWESVIHATGYLIERALGVNNMMNFTSIQTISNGQTITYIDKSGLVNGEWYSYRIAAIDSQSRSAFSSTVSAIPQLTPPTNFKAVGGIESAAIVLSWASVTNATGYSIERALDVNGKVDFFTKIQTISYGQTITYTDKSGLVNGKTYYYMIAAVDTHLTSAFSSIVSAVSQLAAPSNFQAFLNQGTTTVTLLWSCVANATGYKIERGLAVNGTMNFATIKTISNSKTTTYIDKSGLQNENTYYYRIVAVDKRSENKSWILSLLKNPGLLSSFSSVIEVTVSSTLSANSRAINVRKGDLAKEKVDAIVISSSSDGLRKAILKAAGPTIETAYTDAQKANPFDCIITTLAGQLSCKKIFFLPWNPSSDSTILRKSIKDFVNSAIHHAIDHNLRSIAFPPIGCGGYGSPIDQVAEVMVSEAINQLETLNHSLEVVFVVLPDREDIYGKFIEQKKKFEPILTKSISLNHNGLPSNWERSNNSNQIRFTVSMTSAEYNLIIDQFEAMIEPYSPTIVGLERIQNERWYKQYKAHEEDFRKRLNKDTSRTLYHGCSEDSANAIISEGFNRSFAGVNGTFYGSGVYFAADAHFSHRYTRVNSAGERCMFVAKVLIGNSIVGDSSMKVCPVGYDSTTNTSNSIFVAYHDAQSYAEYLITYK